MPIRISQNWARTMSEIATIIRVERGSSRVEAQIELGKRRHHLDDDDAHQEDRQRDQDDRIDHRGNRLRPDGIDRLRVGDEAAQHRIEIARPLARHQRSGVDRRKQVAVRGECVRQRRAASHLLVNIVEHGLEHRVTEARPEDVEGLDQRHARLQQGRQLLVEDQELVALDLAALRRRSSARQSRAGASGRGHAAPYPRARA